ncbi:DUF1592 domain-containing protein [bacterium]|nr:DUF1592 domain-containing protein [bacterium]
MASADVELEVLRLLTPCPPSLRFDDPAMPRAYPIPVWLICTLLVFTRGVVSAANPPVEILQKYCGDCHANGANEGSLSFDQLLKSENAQADRPKWSAVWKNLRAQMMPPADQPQLSAAEKHAILAWIEQDVFHLNPQQPDPGRVTLRRLNRTEYRYTIQDLFGISFNTEDVFPADDSGYGFDNIGDVLSLSPLQVEKYLEAARMITNKAIPMEGPHVPTISVYPDNFRDPKNEKLSAKLIPIADVVNLERKQWIEHAGPYDVRISYRLTGAEEATKHTGELVVQVDDREVSKKDLVWDNNELTAHARCDFIKGHNRLVLSIRQKTAAGENEKTLTFSLRKVELRGPTDGSYVEYPESYKRIFFDGPPPAEPAQRTAYARKILNHFTERAYRRPVEAETLDRLVGFASVVDAREKSQGFEKGIAEALTAVLASPRFLFRAESQPSPDDPKSVVPLDEYALASRLSYFLWSSLPDEELFRLAHEGKLRAELRPQVDRMLADKKFDRFIDNFVGQWLRTRDVETMNIDARRILKSKSLEESFAIFNRNLRRSMKEETNLLFGYLVKENRSCLELLTADYSFLNEMLANWYGIEGVKGNDLRKVDLPADGPRGGVLTQASFLVVTSNPTRTSPVKRGLFVLDNLLGSPAPAPPADVPPLEAVKQEKDKPLSMRELMVKHREDPLCASCHARMDPLGLALEEFDALGRWRNEDQGQPIETAGQLITGEKFGNVRELSRVIANERRQDFYTCLTEKLLTYALGRGIEYYDAPAVDGIIEQLHEHNGAMRTLFYGVVESAPFQLRRGDGVD